MATEARPTPSTASDTSAVATSVPVLRWVIAQRLRALVGWAVAVAAVSAIYVSFYPAMGDTGELEALLEGLPEGLVTALGYDRIGSAAGYVESTVFALLGPILLTVFAVATGARLIAGEEEAGELELELTAPVSRRRLYLERAAALAIATLWLTAVLGAVSAALVVSLDIDVGVVELVGATIGLFALVGAFGALAFAAGAASGRRAVALGIGAGVAVVAYMADAIGGLVDGASWLQSVSPFAWYLGEQPLTDGIDLVGISQLAALWVVALAVGLLAFERRDLGT